MLAYELYLKNKDYKGEAVKVTKPIKKIFVNNDEIIIDKKTLQYYGSSPLGDSSFIQDWLSMPLNTSNAERLNLPDKGTGSRSKPPYIKLYGLYNKIKAQEKIILSIQGKKAAELRVKEKIEFKAEYDLNNLTFDISAEKKIFPNIDNENYKIDDTVLYDKYLETKIIDKDGFFSASKFKDITLAFFDFVKNRPKPEGIKSKKTFFEIFILPADGHIKYIDSNNSNSKKGSEYYDSFENKCSAIASDTTKTAKFLSYDDRAFTINCKQEQEFYKNLGIGKESLEKINIPSDNVFNIRGLNWIFTNLSNLTVDFQRFDYGIYSQLYKNYKRLASETDAFKGRAELKIICYKKQQAKIEILIDENMTMERMKKIFQSNDEGPAFSFEVLIEKNDKNMIIKNYINAIHNLITSTPVDKFMIIEIFTRLLRKKIFSWIVDKKKSEAREFFDQSEFCLKTLLINNKFQKEMDENEEYAYKIGIIAGQYINFKKKIKEENNSLKDILTYSKYDREKLRFVFSRVGIGTSLSKGDKYIIESMDRFITQHKPKNEISDDKAFTDYSYFFFKGVYSKIEGGD